MEESKTYLKNISIPPKKLRFYLASVKKMKPTDAMERLFYGRQRATKVLYQAVKSAVSNAKQTLKVDADLLSFKVLTIEEGQKLKRYRPGSRGSPKPVIKRKSHIKIVLIAKDKIKDKKLEIKKPASVKSTESKEKK
ncbi:hypothetical protein HZA76_03950 [Candidatus Roizmanbacteria bacterium]|nr:hypothetical protein [Candidatus Roizmanbacteria bacterium]